MEKLNELIGKCVLKGIMFPGTLGSQSYSVQDLIHSCSLNTLNNMWKSLKKELSTLDTDSLFKSQSSTKKNKISLQVDTVAAIFEYRQELEEAARNRAKAREEAQKKLAILTHAKDKAEIDRINSLSPKKLAKEIEEAEALANG